MKINKTRMICEAAIFIAMAEILSLIPLYKLPNGGSVTLEMLPIILFAARYGCGWGSLAGLVYGAIIGGVLRFLAHYLIGVFVWGKWMPDEFFGMTMTSPWFYSLLYNGSYMLPSIILCLVVFALLYKPLRKYFTSADLLAA